MMGLDAGSLFGFFGGTKHNTFIIIFYYFAASCLSERLYQLTLSSFWGLFFFLLVGCMHLRMLVGSIALYFTAFDDFSLSVKHLWNIEPL